jgi:hypothetical protein
LTITLTCALASPSAAAAIIQTYTDLDAWSAAVDQFSTATFEGLAPPNGYVTYGASGLSFPGVKFTGYYGTQYSLTVVNDIRYPAYNWNSGALLFGPTGNATLNSRIEAAFSSPQTAFAIEAMTFGMGNPVWVSIGSGPVFQIGTQLSPNRTFWGIASSEPISVVRIWTVDGMNPMLDNFRFGDVKSSEPVIDPPPVNPPDVSDIPEPSTMWLMAAGAGLVALPYLRRRR